ncbi:menaquinone biosynthesis decarboxylase [bacterium]|nr:menaquinone biosynthesis decarboxylase [bacterium]
MKYRDLREFIAFLEGKGELKRISTPVSWELEIAEIADRVVKRGGPALLFENVDGYSIPVLINMYGSERRMAWALGVENVEELAERLSQLLGMAREPPRGIVDKVRALGQLRRLASFQPKMVSHAPCQEVVLNEGELDLLKFPILKCWPLDGGRYITLPLVITRDPETGVRNAGMYRIQVFDSHTAGMHWQTHKVGAHHYRVSRELGRERVDVAVVLGGDPATIWTGSAPVPPDVDEMAVAGFIRQEGVDLVKCKTVDLEVPAQAEIVIEGYVVPGDERMEGPFGDHTGYYSHPGPYPVMHVTAITHRRQPVYPHIVVGKPLQEDWFLGHATERIFLPLVQLLMSEIRDWHFPPEGVFHNCLLVSINKRYAGQARKVIHAIWGIGMLSLTKLVVVVDGDVDVQNPSEAVFHALANVDASRDLVLDAGAVDVLDHSSPVEGYGGKLGVDATRGMAGEDLVRPWPAQVDMDPAVAARLAPLLKRLGI